MKGTLANWGLAALAVVALIACVPASLGAYLESEGEEGRIMPPPLPSPPPPPRYEADVVDFVTGLSVGSPYTHAGLTVFPLLARYRTDGTEYLSLDEAKERGLVNIYETDDISSLEVENLSRRHLFLLAGEIVVGGKQNRLVREDVLLPPRSGRVRVPVYCGERSRWQGRYEHFSSKGQLSSFEMRQMIQEGASQERVWGQVQKELSAARVSSPTEDLAATYDDTDTQRRLREYRQRILAPLPRDSTGVAVAAGRTLLGVDVFSDAELFRELRQKVLDSYVIGWRPWERERYYTRIGREDVRRFLDRIEDARISLGHTPGAGRRIDVSGHGITGTGLAFRRDVVHLSLYEGFHILPMRE